VLALIPEETGSKHRKFYLLINTYTDNFVEEEKWKICGKLNYTLIERRRVRKQVRNTKRIAKFALPSSLICDALYRHRVTDCVFVVCQKWDNGNLLFGKAPKVDAIIVAFEK